MIPSSTTSPCLSWQGDAFSVMAGCTVFGALFDIYKFHHRHDDEKKK